MAEGEDRTGSRDRSAPPSGGLPALRGGRRIDVPLEVLPVRVSRAKLGGSVSRTDRAGSQRELREHGTVIGAPGVVDGPCPHGDEVIREEDVVDAHER